MEMNLNVEVNEQDIIDNLDAEEIFEMATLSESHCKDHFGTGLLDEFTLAEIVECCGEDELLNEIGEGAVIKHFNIDVVE